jgi:hypothetical protein
MRHLEASRLWTWTTPQHRQTVAQLVSRPNFGSREARAVGRVLDVASRSSTPPLWLPGCTILPLRALIRDRSGLWRIFEITIDEARFTPTEGTA